MPYNYAYGYFCHRTSKEHDPQGLLIIVYWQMKVHGIHKKFILP